VPETAPAAYNAGTTYALDNTCCTGTAGAALTVWKSLQSGNIGHAPASSPTWWAQVGEVYSEHDLVTSWALGAIVQVAATHQVYESLAAANLGNPVTDTTKWQPRGYTNRWKMFDTRNDTQTLNADAIIIDLTPAQIANGLYIAGMEADSVTVTVTDPVEGVVYSVTSSMILSNSGGSFFNWFLGASPKKLFTPRSICRCTSPRPSGYRSTSPAARLNVPYAILARWWM